MEEDLIPPTLGDMAPTVKRNRHGKLLTRPRQRLHTVGMDIGYGSGTSPGGHRYALTLVDFSSRHTLVYGLPSKSGRDVVGDV